MTTQTDLLKKYGLSVKGKLGQHILTDPNIQKKIVDLLEIEPQDTIFEIGPGLGALTRQMLGRGWAVTAVEKDKRFSEILNSELGVANPGRLTVYTEDIMKFDFRRLGPAPVRVISNLPYYITAPVLFRLIENRDRIRSAVLTMQKEVAARILARPGSKDYGRLTLSVRFFSRVRQGFDIPPSCFAPRPEVDSSVLSFSFHPRPGFAEGRNAGLFLDIVKIAFSQRRKKLFSLLAKALPAGRDREELTAIFRKAGFPADCRGEELFPEQFAELTGLVEKAGLTPLVPGKGERFDTGLAR